jgi:FkbM family methyltransferase
MIISITRKLQKAIFLTSISFGRKIKIGNRLYDMNGFLINRLALNKSHEPWLDFAYRVAFKIKEGAFIDVGANTGQTLLKVLAIDANRTYIGFEPQLDCCFYIDSFIKNNHLNKCKILPIGLHNKTAIMNLMKRVPNSDLTASVIEGFRPNEFYTSTQSIYVTTGDEMLSHLPLADISTIKIDVEGGELEVLEGLKNSMERYTPFVFFEVLNHFIVVTGQEIDKSMEDFRETRVNKLDKLLRSLGYSIFNILPDKKLIETHHIKPIKSDDLNITNYIAVHATLRESFQKIVHT